VDYKLKGKINVKGAENFFLMWGLGTKIIQKKVRSNFWRVARGRKLGIIFPGGGWVGMVLVPIK
jgi:hypothetical protein